MGQVGAAGAPQEAEGAISKAYDLGQDLSEMIQNLGSETTATVAGDTSTTRASTTAELTKDTLEIGQKQAMIEMYKGGAKTAEKQAAKAGQSLSQG
jgi:hypothetical protein